MAQKNDANQGKRKGLPNRAAGSHASHARRERSYTRGEARKKLRRERQEAAHRANLLRIKDGQLTPWQEAKLKARRRRENDPARLREYRLGLSDALEMKVR